MEDQPSFGQWLKQIRKANELTQDELARQVGCAATTLRLIELDKRRPSKQLAQRLVVVLNVPDEDRAAFLHQARIRPTQNGLVTAHDPHSVKEVEHSHMLNQDNALNECTALLNDPACRLLTIVGPSGTGKTRLASILSTHVVDAFRDGVVFVSLAQINDASMLATVILIALGDRERDQYDGEGWLLDYLHGKELLLILDKFEHLVSGAEQLAQMLQQAPSLKILVTSHKRLALQGEWLYDLNND